MNVRPDMHLVVNTCRLDAPRISRMTRGNTVGHATAVTSVFHGFHGKNSLTTAAFDFYRNRHRIAAESHLS